jgi:PKD domain-containing protein/Big-like domain-containing protein
MTPCADTLAPLEYFSFSGFIVTIRQPRSLLLGLALVLAACGGEGLTLPPDGAAAHIDILWGDNQSARVGEPLPDSVVVRVTDTQSRPVAGVDVIFEFTTGGSAANPGTSTTDADGTTWSRLVLGTIPGEVTGKAKVTVDAGITPVEVPITAIASPADANGIALVSGDAQTGAVGTQLAAPLVVAVTDQFGNPIPGMTVQWSVTGGGSVSSSASITDANGQAAVTRTLGPAAGTQTTVATATGLAGSPVSFNHTATAGTATTVVKIAPLVTEAPAGSVLDLVVEVRDASGNPISNAPVTWLVGEGGGSATPSSNTNSEGRATSRWTLGSAPGVNTLNVVSSGGATTTFTVTGTGTGAPSKLAVSTQPPSSVTVGATLSPAPVVQVKDANGNDVPVAGIEITALVTAGKGSLGGTGTVTTDANGRARFTDLTISGATGSHQLIFSADQLPSIKSSKFDVIKASTVTTITAHSPNPSDPNQPVTVAFTVTSSSGTPTGSVDVTVSGAGSNCSASLSQGSGSCQLTDLASSTTLTATYKGDNLFVTSSGDASHTVNAPPPPNQAPVAAFDAPVGCTALNACAFSSAPSSDPDGTIESWSWTFGEASSPENSSNLENPSHIYALAGDYTVTLTVTDNDGEINTVSHVVTIQ